MNFDKLTYAGNLDNLSDLQYSKHYTFIKGDITNKELVDYIVETHKIDIIVNFAAESHVDRSIANSDEFIKTNNEIGYISKTIDLLLILLFIREKQVKYII